jgi:putative ATP-grasp target RiPP
MSSDAVIGPAWIDFPLAEPSGPVPESLTARPFGLRHSSEPGAVVDLDWGDVRYDRERQIAVVDDPDGVVVPAMKHTSTKTKTTTNTEDRNPPDDDEDWTGS